MSEVSTVPERTTPSAFAEYNIEERATTLHGSVLVGLFSKDGPGPHMTLPHRHDFVELVWLSQGSGTHEIDARRFPAEPRTLHVVAPGQVHCWLPGSTPVEGTLVLFREQLLTGPGGLRPQAWSGGMTRPDPATAARIDRLIEELRIELDGDATDRDATARFLLSALISICARVMVDPPRARQELPAAFTRLVREQRGAALSVAECARRLNVTPNHLTEVITAALGRTPGAVIRSEIVLEAQRMLSRTALTGAQIAAALAFTDPSYFSRFFRREVGTTPTAYRRMHAVRTG